MLVETVVAINFVNGNETVMLPRFSSVKFCEWQSAVYTCKDGRYKLPMRILLVFSDFALSEEVFKHAKIDVNELKSNVCIAWPEKDLIECYSGIVSGMLVRCVVAP